MSKFVYAALFSAAFVVSGTVQSHAVTLDFEGPSSGNIDGDEFLGAFGLTITGFDKDGVETQLALFNSSCDGGPGNDSFPDCTGDDDDLASGDPYGTDPQGNVLIIQENGGEPDDSAQGGSWLFSFLAPVTVTAVELLDLDRNPRGLSFDFAYEGGASSDDVAPLSEQLLSNDTGNNSLTRFTFEEFNVVSLKINLYDSGAVASVDFTPVPLPAGLPLLVAGLGALGLMRRRKRS
ncbi:MAG: VPLPA-CTERM sorting domain-containing protein [Pseudomonadota bacterium]